MRHPRAAPVQWAVALALLAALPAPHAARPWRSLPVAPAGREFHARFGHSAALLPHCWPYQGDGGRLQLDALVLHGYIMASDGPRW